MHIGMIGLGRMGGNMVRRLLRDGHEVSVFNRSAAAIQPFLDAGASGATDLPTFVKSLPAPRAVWLMIPAAAVDKLIADLAPLLSRDDILIDGGNSYYRDDVDRAQRLAASGIHYVDCGTSGGVWGLERGYLHCGPSGAGHFVKMIHNGIEYGVMAAYAEGLNVLRHAGVGKKGHAVDAETTPLRDPQYFQYEFDLADVTEVWRRGSVIASWLLDLTAGALAKSPQLEDFSGKVSDSGEGRWTVLAAIESGVPAHVLTASLYERFDSRGEADFQNRVLSAMRFAFGGHLEKKGV